MENRIGQKIGLTFEVYRESRGYIFLHTCNIFEDNSVLTKMGVDRMGVIPMRKRSRLLEMENAISTLLDRGVTLEEIKAGSIGALVQLVKKENPHFTESEAQEHADQFIDRLFKKVGHEYQQKP